MKKTYLAITPVILIFLTGCSTAITLLPLIPQVQQKMPAVQETLAPTVSKPIKEETFIITAVGDIMMHSTEIKAGHLPGSTKYDFSSFFTKAAPLLQSSDLVIGNLETTLGDDPSKYGGYPQFNSPAVLAENLKNAGFDVLTTANNHCMDKGITGLLSTLQFLDKAELLHTGTFQSQEAKETILTTDIKGIKTAFLSYTYGTNGITPPKKYAFSVNYINETQIKSDIEKARNQGAKLVILSLHFGQEYKNKPNSSQVQLSKSLLDAGADIILGYHPHVLEPVEVYETDTANKKFVIYSQGNFISHQNGMERKSSIILNLHFGVDTKTGEPYFKKATYVPIWTRVYNKNGKQSFEVLPLDQALETIKAGGQTDFTAKEISEFEQAWNHIQSCFAETEPDAENCMELQDVSSQPLASF